jgi:hypothetical protein
MIRINRGISSVSAVVEENSERNAAGMPFFMVVATSSLTVRAWYA